jgi:hypothetical protein
MEMNEQNTLEFVKWYLKAILFTEAEDPPSGEFMPGADLDDICGMFDKESLVVATAAAGLFMNEAAAMIPEDRIADAAANFHYTRNGHGCGFWDGDWPEHGDDLTAICERFGQVDYYLSDRDLMCIF